MWSVGAVLYTLCSGKPPFGAGPMKDVSQSVQRGVLEFGMEFAEYSLNLKDILGLLMTLPWNHRQTAARLLKHAWVSNTRTLHIKDGKISHVALSQLKAYAEEDHVKQTVARLLTDIGLTSKAYKGLEEMFAELDLNADGTISLGELVEHTSKLPDIGPGQVDKIVSKLDRNGNGNVDISEFVAALVLEQDELDEGLIKKAFEKIDRNGDARMNKKEIFGVLRQYSGSLETKQVSNFVGRTDDDGDQKIDYREFMHLFPQVRDKHDELDRRMAIAKASVQMAPKHVERFRETLRSWIGDITKHRDKVELACGMRTLPDQKTAGTRYSYDRGQISEFEVQVIMKNAVTTLKHPPGRLMTKQQKMRHDTGKLEREEGRQPQRKKVVGLSLFSSAAQAAAGIAAHAANIATVHSGSENSGSDGEAGGGRIATGSAVQQWSCLIAKDQAEKRQTPEFKEEEYLRDYLYWLMKVKSDCQWQHPILSVLDELKHVCVEEIFDVDLTTRSELMALRALVDDKYYVKEECQFKGREMRKETHILPMGSFASRNLRNAQMHDKIEDMPLPVTVVFGAPKRDVTHQKIEHMKAVHMEKLAWCARFLSGVLKSIEDFLLEVVEDFTMSGTLESLMPSPPSLSHLYLKHCAGRELAEDCATPRSNDADVSEQEEPVVAIAGGGSMDSSVEGNETSQSQLLMSVNFEGTAQSLGAQGERRRKRLDRNAVLSQTHVARSKSRA